MKKLAAYNLQELLIVLAIIGILLLIAMPSFMPLIAKAKSIEAQVQLKALYHSQKSYFFTHSRYTDDLQALDFEPPLPQSEGGEAQYRYRILSASSTGFKAQAEALADFDGDGVYNLWEIDARGKPEQIQKD